MTPDRWGLLEESRSTIYRWLREGRELGFFQRYWWQGNTLKIRLGGRDTICREQGIKNWGATADDVPLEQLLQGNGRRMIASAITTQDLQQRSHYSARHQLNKLERICFDIPTASQLLGDAPTSPNSASGGASGVIHKGDERLFVDRRFVPFGVSQKHICEVLNSEPTSCGVSRWTLRRHLDRLEVEKRQLVQAKPEYREIHDQLRKGVTRHECESDAHIFIIPTERGGIITIDEPNGRSSARREGGHQVDVNRFTRYFGAVWLYRCNLYDLDYELTSMKFSRQKFKEEMKNLTPTVVVENFALDKTPQTPLEEVTVPIAPEGGMGTDENKRCKNDNSVNQDTEQVSGDIPSIWHETKRKLLEQKHKRQQAKAASVESLSTEPIQQYWQQLYGQ